MHPAEPSPDSDKKSPSHLKSTGVVGSYTMLSRILGLLRDVVIANFIGASASADAFFVAFKIPNFLRRLFAEGAFAQAFVPVLSEYKTQREHRAVKDLVDHVAGTLGLTLALLTGIAVVAAPVIALVFAPGFIQYEEKFALTTDLLRITFPYLFFISLTAFGGSILNSYGRFGVPAFTPVLLNIALICAALFLAPNLKEPVMALGWGVLIAGVAQLLFQLPFLAQLHLSPRPRINRQHEGVKKILILMLPAIFGVSVSQINLLLDTLLASFLQTGSVSWLYYSDRLVELPLGVFGIAIATVILPSLSRLHSSQSTEKFIQTLDWALRSVCLIGVPAALALFILAEPLIITLFQYGAMTERDVAMAAMSLRAYSFGLFAFMLIKVLAPGYFSRQDTKTPVRIAIWAMVTNMVLNLILVWPLQHAGLALATSLSSFLNAGLLFAGLYRLGLYRVQPGWKLLVLRLLFSNAVLVSGVLWFVEPTNIWLTWDWWVRAWHLGLLCLLGVALYFAALLLSGVRFRHFRH
ncbi:MAG: murein biosynthesis integral membrane protein MurJ [Pseudomonadales bacterium]|nr:murein biosynthesis integral membrane protein MurJ [Pseudomonadales bacterium]MCP5213586.1 murein biosynthesis integral membrane protein MurJ [Pseudomonadales bacterium]